MQYTLIFEPVALKEYEDAVVWYNERSVESAERLVIEIEEKLNTICSDPYRYRNTHKKFREISLQTFPFYIVYFINEEAKLLVIFSFYHHKRNPKKKYKKQ